MPDRPGLFPELLIVGRSGRALAASASRAGYCCDVIDEFLDTDTSAIARHAWRLAPDFTVDTLVPLLDERQRLHGSAETIVLPGSGFEAVPAMLTRLQEYGAVAANPASVVRRLKEPARFFPLLDRLGIRHPPVSLEPVTDRQAWLSKPIGGEGGVGIMPWLPADGVPPGRYLQQRREGLAVSVLFLADGSRARLIGFNRCFTAGELHGDRDDFRFAEIVRMQPLPEQEAETMQMVSAVARASGLRGLCGMDMLWNDSGISVFEINPRPPASFELHEDPAENGGSLVAAHLVACAGALPQRLTAVEQPSLVAGKRVVYCHEAVHIPDGFSWPAWTADRPAPGRRLEAGMPLCTILCRAATGEDCREMLQQRHDDLLADIKNNLQATEFNKFKVRKEMTA